MYRPVSSSAIQGVEYFKKKQELVVYFTDGDVTTYSGVPDDVYKAFMKAKSKGHYFNFNIRDVFSHS